MFFGFEAPTSRGLRSLHKDADVGKTVEAVRIARKLGFGVTGNFIIDPDYTEEDFEALWAFLREQELSRVGFTILTPLPGTVYFEQHAGPAGGRGLEPVRPASPALAAAPAGSALLRAVLRDLAAVRAVPAGAEEVVAAGCRRCGCATFLAWRGSWPAPSG